MSSKRPSTNDKEINLAAAKLLLPKVLEWLRNNGGEREAEEEQDSILSEVESTIFLEDDGYQIAQQLERDAAWNADSELVDIMSEASVHKYRAREAAEKEWLKTSGLSALPQFSSVRWTKNEEYGVGIIADNNHDTGYSTVSFASKGHITPTAEKPVGIQHGTIGFVIPWEQIVPA